MYSFAPLVSEVSHCGFYFICGLSAIAVLLIFSEEGIVASVFAALFLSFICLFAYNVSYHWTSQIPTAHKNEKVVGQLVRFQPEGYSEQSGKTRSDKHYMYVVYNVDGNHVILQAAPGKEYPKNAILYKN